MHKRVLAFVMMSIFSFNLEGMVRNFFKNGKSIIKNYSNARLVAASFYGPRRAFATTTSFNDVVNHVGHKNKSALHRAALAGAAHSVRALLDAGVNHLLIDEEGRLPLHLAALSGDYQTLLYLLDEGVFIDTEDNNGDTALHLANDGESIKLLLDCEANSNALNKKLRTPLHAAVIDINFDKVTQLVIHNVDTSFKDIDGKTAEDLIPDIIASMGLVTKQEDFDRGLTLLRIKQLLMLVAK